MFAGPRPRRSASQALREAREAARATFEAQQAEYPPDCPTCGGTRIVREGTRPARNREGKPVKGLRCLLWWCEACKVASPVNRATPKPRPLEIPADQVPAFQPAEPRKLICPSCGQRKVTFSDFGREYRCEDPCLFRLVTGPSGVVPLPERLAMWPEQQKCTRCSRLVSFVAAGGGAFRLACRDHGERVVHPAVANETFGPDLADRLRAAFGFEVAKLRDRSGTMRSSVTRQVQPDGTVLLLGAATLVEKPATPPAAPGERAFSWDDQ